MELGQIAEIYIGILPSREQSLEGTNKYQIFDLKLLDDNSLEFRILNTYKNLENKLTQKNDIIFRLIYPNRVILVDNKKLENLLINSHFCIIRVNTEIIDPVFLKWYLESDKCKEQLAINAMGTTIQKVSINDLRKIKVPKIDLETQEKLRDLIILWEQEKKNTKEILKYKEIIYNNIIEEIIE